MKYLVCTSLLITALMFTSCQEEFEEIIETNEQETIVASSTTAKLVQNTVSNDGSFDNIVDGASCFAINFPYTVEVNGLEITINSIPDLRLIEEILDAVDDDSDLLEIIFPITITLEDFTEIVINGIQDFREIAEKCKEGGDDDDIECIDFVYPITLYTFDINQQQTGNVIVNSDRELRRFFAGLDDNDIISIEFPVELKLYDGTEIIVNNNAELADAIERAKNACDEDDDNDHNDDDFTKERLDNYLVQCPWLVKELERDDENQTDQYYGYLMTFTEDGAVIVKDRQGNMITGTWSTRVTDFRVLLKLEFDVLVDFNLDWFIYEIEEGKIKLFADGGNKIVMKKVCGILQNTPDTLREILKECSWAIAKVIVAGDSIDRLLGFEFKFMADNVITLSDGITVSEGTWEITKNDLGVLVMAITIGAEGDISFEWPLRELANDRLKFEIPETEYELVLERDCEDDVVCSESFISEVLSICKWKITNLDGTFFEDLQIDFSNRNIHVFNTLGEVVEEGSWEIADTTVKFNNLSATLANYIGEWKVIACEGERLKISRGDEIIVLTKMCE